MVTDQTDPSSRPAPSPQADGPDAPVIPPRPTGPRPPDMTEAEARTLSHEEKRDRMYASLSYLLDIAERRAALRKAGLPMDEEDDLLTRPVADAMPVAGRLGGDDGQGGGWTADRQRAFLGHLAECASVTHACRLVGLSKQSAYALRARTPQSVFAILWDVAVRFGRRRLYDEALERALAGRTVPVWHRGEEVGTRHVPNDRLLMFLLAHEPPAAHPVLDQRQLAELWPALLTQVDAVLPPSLTPDRLAEMGVDCSKNGNDRR